MSEGQRKARNCQRWLMAIMLVAIACMWAQPNSPGFDRMSNAFIVCWAAYFVVDAMRALARDSAGPEGIAHE